MNKSSFSLVFEGHSVKNGEIDIQDLASSFMAMAAVIQEANTVINGDKARVSVKLQATGKGSVIVNLVIVQSIFEQAASLFDTLAGHKDGISAAKDLSDVIFKVGGVGVGAISGGYLCLMKWLDRKKPDKIVQHGQVVHIHKGDSYFIADQRAIALVESIPVREQSKKLVLALDREGIDKISVFRKDEETLIIEKDDIDAFGIPDTIEEAEVLKDVQQEMFLQIDSLSFKEGNKWKMTQGDESFFVAIEDTNFLSKVKSGKIAFAINDVLRCLVNEEQVQTIKGSLKTERIVLQVLEYKKGNKQLELL
jgi:hypothetical protein